MDYQIRFAASGMNHALVHGRLDPITGSFELSSPIPSPLRISYLDYHAKSGLLLGLWIPEHDDVSGDLIAFDPDNPTAQPVFQLTTHENGPCHMAINDEAKLITVPNFKGGTLAVFRWDGSRESVPTLIEHLQLTGSSIVPIRQVSPRPHGVAWSPDGKRLYLCDLGTDRISWFAVSRWTTGEGIGEPASDYVKAKPGSGPRHCAFDPSGQNLYVSNEMTRTIAAYRIDSATGTPSLISEQTTVIGPDGAPVAAPDQSTVAEIAVHPSGRWVYVSNRGPNTIAVFARDLDGQVRPVGSFGTQGDWPWHFSIEKEGRLMLVANTRSNSACLFELDERTGMGVPLGQPIPVSKPWCAQIYAVKGGGAV